MGRLEDDPLYRAKALVYRPDVQSEEVDALVYGRHSERSEESQSSSPKHRVAAPRSFLPGASAVQGVMLAANEYAHWSWTHTANGSYVSGYTIVPNLAPRPVILSDAKNLSRSQRGRGRR